MGLVLGVDHRMSFVDEAIKTLVAMSASTYRIGLEITPLEQGIFSKVYAEYGSGEEARTCAGNEVVASFPVTVLGHDGVGDNARFWFALYTNICTAGKCVFPIDYQERREGTGWAGICNPLEFPGLYAQLPGLREDFKKFVTDFDTRASRLAKEEGLDTLVVGCGHALSIANALDFDCTIVPPSREDDARELFQFSLRSRARHL